MFDRQKSSFHQNKKQKNSCGLALDDGQRRKWVETIVLFLYIARQSNDNSSAALFTFGLHPPPRIPGKHRAPPELSRASPDDMLS